LHNQKFFGGSNVLPQLFLKCFFWIYLLFAMKHDKEISERKLFLLTLVLFHEIFMKFHNEK